MQIKKKLILILVIISFLSFSYSSAKIIYTPTNDYTDFYYSDHIIPDEELIWNVAKFDVEDDVNWTIKPGYDIKEGDVLKFVITVDPDELTLSDNLDLHFTDQEWAEFYLNDDYLGNDASELNFFIIPFTSSYWLWAYLLPTELEFATGNQSTFEYLYDESEPMEFKNDSGLFDVTLTDDLFTMQWELHASGVLIFVGGTYKLDQVLEISYNIEWGYLDRIKIYEMYKYSGEKEVAEIVLLNSRSTQRVPIKWTVGFYALLILGAIAVYRRRR
ncbi:MAG: hypothetical protein FK733_10365 [Asgard group archaeon]|nr:hypothetical protein [Asgard group archaeon]